MLTTFGSVFVLKNQKALDQELEAGTALPLRSLKTLASRIDPQGLSGTPLEPDRIAIARGQAVSLRQMLF